MKNVYQSDSELFPALSNPTFELFMRNGRISMLERLKSLLQKEGGDKLRA
jgi:hypothetical protein